MTGLSQAFQDHLSGEVTTLCHCWRVERIDGRVLGFTDHDSPLEFDGTSYQPDSGFTASRHQESLGFAADGVDVEGALSSGALDEADILRGAFDRATVQTFLVNWARPEQRRMLRVATIGALTLADGAFLAELRGLSAGLDRVTTRVYRRACDAEIGDRRCAVDLDLPQWRGTGMVTALEEPRTLVVSGLDDFAAGGFSGGMLSWTGGARAGRTERIAAHANSAGLVRLQLGIEDLSGLDAGDSFTMTAGCDKRFATCRDRFGNGVNFRGFPHLPGNDTAYGYVAPDLPLNGKPVVP
ncbi:MAG: DUF2163 domain-containing protein [Notoacmeibacter sp.]|nr:DUF2163 domain-containing protein [Notoacmeibacter sp.]